MFPTELLLVGLFSAGEAFLYQSASQGLREEGGGWAVLIFAAAAAALAAFVATKETPGAFVNLLAPACCGLALREAALARLGDQSYASSAMLLLALPLHWAGTGQLSPNTLPACAACALLYGSLLPEEPTLSPSCASLLRCAGFVWLVALGAGGAAAKGYESGKAVGAGLVGASGGLLGAAMVSAPVGWAAASSGLKAGLLASVAAAAGKQHSLADCVVAAVAGGCVAYAPTGRLAGLLPCATLVLAILAIRRRPESEASAAQGLRPLLLSLLLLLVFSIYPPPAPQASCRNTHHPSSHAVPPEVRHKRLEEAYRTDRLVNGAILYLDSKRKPIQKALTLFQQHFLGCWPYPIHVFKENPGPGYLRGVQRSTSSPVYVHNVNFDQPPNNITMETVDFWIDVKRYGRGHHFGYRMMCRFFAGVFAKFEFLKEFDYYWRLDTDSWFKETVKVDPFRFVAVRGCKYGHMSPLHRDAAEVTINLYDTVLEWAEEHKVPKMNVTRLAAVVTDGKGKYRRPMYYNNFEIASVPWITGEDYRSFFEYLDFTDGFMKYRWGDAPVRTIAVHLMLKHEEICDLEKHVPYHHGFYKNKVYSGKDHNRPLCPATVMKMNDDKSYYLHPPVYTNEDEVKKQQPSPAPSPAPSPDPTPPPCHTPAPPSPLSTATVAGLLSLIAGIAWGVVQPALARRV